MHANTQSWEFHELEQMWKKVGLEIALYRDRISLFLHSKLHSVSPSCVMVISLVIMCVCLCLCRFLIATVCRRTTTRPCMTLNCRPDLQRAGGIFPCIDRVSCLFLSQSFCVYMIFLSFFLCFCNSVVLGWCWQNRSLYLVITVRLPGQMDRVKTLTLPFSWLL